ncbi:hypothetical protein [Actinoplanes sp. NPDC026623]|jgi:hypothetical protein|uniref:hypothetical protein n=1 Tax=Actinoplanes sp. NPDC026623 TaxID=3155610 RepID=UPI0033E69854
MVQFEHPDDIPGTAVWSADGHSRGRIGAVHIPYGMIQPLFVQFPAGAPRQRLVPTVDAELRDRGLVLGYSDEVIDGGPTVEGGAVLSAGEAAYAAAYYGVKIDLGGAALTERRTGVGDVGSLHPGVRRLPPVTTDPELPPIVVINPGLHEGPAR